MRNSTRPTVCFAARLCILTLASVGTAFAQVERQRADSMEGDPWHEAYVILSDGRLIGDEIAFRNAVASPDRGVVEDAALSDTLWLCSESYTELVPARFSEVLLVLFQYGPVASPGRGETLEVGRRVVVVNREHSAIVLTLCGPGRLSRLLPVTTGIVVRDETEELRRFRPDEFFFTPRQHVSEAERIEAIVFRR